MNSRLFSHEYNFLKFDYWFGQIDSRPFSAFRIVFALLLLKDALYHLPLAGLFYSDGGLAPRAVLLGGMARPERFSLMDALGHEWMAAAFFVLWAGIAVALLIGYRTRLLTILNFLLILSIHERNVYLLTGADTALRLVSFWMMFIPLGDHYSIDARRCPREYRTAFAFPVRLIQFQIALIYLVAGILKLSGAMWQNGDALFYVLQLESIQWPPGVWLREVAPDGLLRLLTWGTFMLELVFMPLVFAPFFQPRLRALALLGGAAMHLGIAVTMAIPDFSLVMMTSYLLFFEPSWVQWLVDHLPFRKQLWRIGSSLSNLLYPDAKKNSFVANDSAPITQGAKYLSYRRLALISVLALLMVAVIAWNLTEIISYTDPPAAPLPEAVEDVMWYSGLWQYWDLFAPMPLQIDGRIAIPGVFEDGATADLYAAHTSRPLWGPEIRWRKFEENINNYRYDELLRAWGRYYCHLYNDVFALPEGERLATLEIHFVYRRSHAPGEPANPMEDDLLWEHWCYEEYRY
jgi:hypothetical protein